VIFDDGGLQRYFHTRNSLREKAKLKKWQLICRRANKTGAVLHSSKETSAAQRTQIIYTLQPLKRIVQKHSMKKIG